MMQKKPDYPEEYKGILRFSDFRETITTLVTLQKLREEALGSGNKKALQDLKALAAVGEKRARGIAAKPKVQPAVRKAKREIARWFSIWRENPGIFFSWVLLRIQSPEFLSDFGDREREAVRHHLADPGARAKR